MKIVISSTGKTVDDFIDVRFGRCKYFLIIDTEDEKITSIENKGQESSGGAGIVAAQQLIDEKIDVVITGNLGPNAYKIMEESGIKAYQCEKIQISMVLEKYNNGELEGIKLAGPAHHN
ncbi:MAG: NifB/NifX family molybdenum-iron cluster-binding protein [Eubacteriaceae bacterium]